jgi:hypothetical protein
VGRGAGLNTKQNFAARAARAARAGKTFFTLTRQCFANICDKSTNPKSYLPYVSTLST